MGVLFARVSGAWQPVSYSSADRWNTAWGCVAYGTFTASQITLTPAGTAIQVTNPMVFTPLTGRRYRITFSLRAMSGGTSQTYYGVILRNGSTALNNQLLPLQPVAGYNTLYYSWSFIGDNIAKSYNVTMSGGNVSTIYPDNTYDSAFYLEDIGPVAGAAAIPNPTPAWNNLTFAGTWVNLDAVSGYPASYRIIGDVVSVRGLVKSTGNDLIVGTLPVGFRPQRLCAFATYGQAAPSGTQAAFRVLVNAGGQIALNWAAGLTVNSVTYMDLDVIQFSVTL